MKGLERKDKERMKRRRGKPMVKKQNKKENKQNKLMKGIDVANPANFGERMADKVFKLFS